MEEARKTITAYKGFDKDLKCRGFQYEIGGEYIHDGPAIPCQSGFHACEHPLSVFGYYAPADSRFAVVEIDAGAVADGDKHASAFISIKAELSIPALIEKAVAYVFDRATPEDTEHSTGDQGAASSTGDQGAASSTGYRGAASSTGNYGAAMASGYGGKALASKGSAIFLVERNDGYEIVNVFAGIAGAGEVEPDTWYTLKGGKLVAVGEE